MSKNHLAGLTIKTCCQVFGYGIVREVTSAAHDPLLQGPGVRANLQHINIVVRFEDDSIAPSQALYNQVRDISQIQNYSNLDAVPLDAERQRIDGIVRDSEGSEDHPGRLEWDSRFNTLALAWVQSHTGFLQRTIADENRDIEIL